MLGAKWWCQLIFSCRLRRLSSPFSSPFFRAKPAKPRGSGAEITPEREYVGELASEWGGVGFLGKAGDVIPRFESHILGCREDREVGGKGFLASLCRELR
ncbi:unnamed protein product [Bursaphelenchus xylophilus]|uniref:(pine wood nematode) hypothetical protein n=1 Tax=Bursaphelenchus xylophilus TaxID=6326 RepID=A0A7I8WMI6_BURXY|nr:unnamed protein product [Bursaphelenchus xylophilus]CAG9104275.1 unnamed protein product [Bursaphelenchus xylophilus]